MRGHRPGRRSGQREGVVQRGESAYQAKGLPAEGVGGQALWCGRGGGVSSRCYGQPDPQPVVTAKMCMAEVLDPTELLMSGRVIDATVFDESIGIDVA